MIFLFTRLPVCWFQIQTMNDNSQAIFQYHFNQIDKIVELYERIIKEKDALIENKRSKLLPGSEVYMEVPLTIMCYIQFF